MTTRILCIATAAAMVAGAAAAQPYGYTGGYLPAPAYAYAGQGYGQDEQAYDEGRCDGFTLLGAHGGVTVLGIDAGVGGHLGVGGGCGHPRRRIGFVPPPQPPQPPVYAPPPQPQYALPAPPCCAPPPPCGCEPGGW